MWPYPDRLGALSDPVVNGSDTRILLGRGSPTEFLAAFIGTVALVIIGRGVVTLGGHGAVFGSTQPFPALARLPIAFAFGLAIVAMACGIGPVLGRPRQSGGHRRCLDGRQDARLEGSRLYRRAGVRRHRRRGDLFLIVPTLAAVAPGALFKAKVLDA